MAGAETKELPPDPMIQETLKPLLKNREELEEKLTDLDAERSKIKEALTRVEKILRAGGLIEAYRPAAQEAKKNGAGKNARRVPKDEILAEYLKAAEAVAAEGYEEFTIRDIAERIKGGKDLHRIKLGLDELRADHRIRLAGRRIPDGNEGGGKAMHFALIK